MDRKKFLNETIKYGLQSEKNRREIINSAAMVISVLNNANANKKLSKDELNKLTGGGDCSGNCFCG